VRKMKNENIKWGGGKCRERHVYLSCRLCVCIYIVLRDVQFRERTSIYPLLRLIKII
jgi:hypothetical protein